MIDHKIRNRFSAIASLHPLQFTYQKGKSAESALHSLVTRLEKTLEDKKIALSALIHFEGVFGSTGFGSMTEAIQSLGIDQ